MYDDYYYPYKKAPLWTKNLMLLVASNFLLYVSLYVLLPTLPIWVSRMWYRSFTEAGMVTALFGVGMFIPGVFNAFLIDFFPRKGVCFFALLLLVAVGGLYPEAGNPVAIALLRLAQGALFGTVTMTTGSTLVIDVTASHRRTNANVVFSWSGRLGMAVGLAVGMFFYPYWSFVDTVYLSLVPGVLALLLIVFVRVPFRAPLYPPVVSLDRFLLPRAFWPAVNMMMLAFVFGVLAVRMYSGWFFLCVLAGLAVVALFASRWLVNTSARSEFEMGQAALLGGLLLLTFTHGLLTSYVAGLLIGIGMGIAASRFFLKMVSLPLHCERGTGNNTYQLAWELGMMAGVVAGNSWTLYPSQAVYWICMGVCVAALLMYECFTHRWYYRRMDERQGFGANE